MRVAAFFDLDGTLLKGESQLLFLLWCAQRKIVPVLRSLKVLVRYAAYLLGISSDVLLLRKEGLGLLAGVEVKRLEAAGEDFFRECLVARLRRQSLEIVEAHRRNGHVIVLVTAASEVVARPVATWLKTDALIATVLEQERGVLLGIRQLPEPYGEGKLLLVRQFADQHGISLQHSFAYADHHSDASLLAMAGHPFAVNPTSKLRALAEARLWTILDLDSSNPVT